jgi:hypothetical protein
MRFPEFLKTTVLISAASATLLAVVTLAGSNDNGDSTLVPTAAVWWLIAAIIGSWLGRGHSRSKAIASLLAAARTQASLPELNPSRTLINRLWPLLICTIGAGAIAFAYPQVSAIAAGFPIIWALAWRHQSAAVSAIEERDGARFYIERTSPLAPIKLVRTPGFRSNLAEMNSAQRASGVAGRHA